MLDPRFYKVISTPTIAEIGEYLGTPAIGGRPDTRLIGFAPFDRAEPGHLTFFAGKGAPPVESCDASACVSATQEPDKASAALSLFVCSDPRGAFARAASAMAQRLELTPGPELVHSQALIAPTAIIEPGAVVGSGAAVGDRTRIGSGTVIGPGVQIGKGCRIAANATVYCALIGDNVQVLPGAVIGENGFGLPHDASTLIAHFGRVIIQDHASIGANSCVDRGMLGDTLIGERTHIDNLCHIGHNVKVGSRSVMAAFAGVSGSSIVGDNVMFGGRVGLSDHVTVGEGARIAAGAAVLEDVPAGQTWAGYPAKPIRSWMRELAWLRRAAQKRLSDG